MEATTERDEILDFIRNSSRGDYERVFRKLLKRKLNRFLLESQITNLKS
jgi:hypothetical protein